MRIPQALKNRHRSSFVAPLSHWHLLYEYLFFADGWWGQAMNRKQKSRQFQSTHDKDNRSKVTAVSDDLLDLQDKKKLQTIWREWKRTFLVEEIARSKIGGVGCSIERNNRNQGKNCPLYHLECRQEKVT